MNRSPRFSVVVPAYNYGATLPVALESVLIQGRDDVEIVLVDDASTDETPRIIGPYLDSIRYFRNETNRGHPRSWYRAMQESRGEYIVNLDADDWLLPNYFNTIERVLSHDIGIVVNSVYDYRVDTDSVELRGIAKSNTKLSAHAFRNRLLSRIFFRTPGMVLRRELAIAAAPPDPRIWNADWEFVLRASRGYGAYLMSAPLAVYRIHPKSISGEAKASTHRLQKSCDLFLDITRDPSGPAYLEVAERRRFARGLAELYLRIVGSRMSLGDTSAALKHLQYAMRLSGSEHFSAAAGTAAFFIGAAVQKAIGPIFYHEPAAISVRDLLPASKVAT